MGVSCPGDIDGGLVSADNLRWRSVPFANILHAHSKRPLMLCQDGQAAMQAERERGSLTGWDNAVFLVVGTGIGGDVLVGGRSLRAGFSPEEILPMATSAPAKWIGVDWRSPLAPTAWDRKFRPLFTIIGDRLFPCPAQASR